MIALGVTVDSTDMHLTAQLVEGNGEPQATLRYRIDGVLYEYARLDMRLLPAAIAQWKRMAACSPDEHTRTQDGRIMVSLDALSLANENTNVDIRMIFTPSMVRWAHYSSSAPRPLARPRASHRIRTRRCPTLL